MELEQIIDETISGYFSGFEVKDLQDIVDVIDSLEEDEIKAVEEGFFSGEDELVEHFFEINARPHAEIYLQEANLGRLGNQIRRADNKSPAKSAADFGALKSRLDKDDPVKKSLAQINTNLAQKKQVAANKDTAVKNSLAQINSKLAQRRQAQQPQGRVISIPKQSAASKAGKAIKGAMGAVRDKAKEVGAKAKAAAPGILKRIGSVAGKLIKGGAKVIGKVAAAPVKVAANVASRTGDVAKAKIRSKHPGLAHAMFGHEDEKEAAVRKAIIKEPEKKPEAPKADAAKPETAPKRKKAKMVTATESVEIVQEAVPSVKKAERQAKIVKAVADKHPFVKKYYMGGKDNPSKQQMDTVKKVLRRRNKLNKPV